MSIADLADTTAVVTGASRGFGRAIASSLVARGAHVVGVARSNAQLDQVHQQLGESFIPVVADLADDTLAARMIADYRPRLMVLNAGATPGRHRCKSRPGSVSARTGRSMSSTSSVSCAKR